jgi:hypothetical protein
VANGKCEAGRQATNAKWQVRRDKWRVMGNAEFGMRSEAGGTPFNHKSPFTNHKSPRSAINQS